MKSTSAIAYAISTAAAGKKAMDIKILNLKDISPITDYFVLCSGNSTVQVKAIADEIEDKMQEIGMKLNHKEGYRDGKWILLDFESVIAHIFYKEDREFYDIERVWADAQIINV